VIARTGWKVEDGAMEDAKIDTKEGQEDVVGSRKD